MDRKVLGQQIRVRRQSLQLTQEQLAERMDVSTTYIGLVERGERSITLEKLILLSDCLHIPLDDLVRPAEKTVSVQRDSQMQYIWQNATENERELILALAQTVIDHSTQNGLSVNTGLNP